MDTKTTSLIADTAMLAGTLILENGGETYRAEETAYHVCMAGGLIRPEIFALPTGIFFTSNQGLESEQHGFVRIHQTSIHLYKLERTNRYCRAYVRGEMGIEELHRLLKELRESNIDLPFLKRLLISGLTAAAFAIMLDGGIHDGWIAFVCGLFLAIVTEPLTKSTISTVTVNMAGGAVIALAAVLLTHFTHLGNLDIIIVSSNMSLLPGLATLNAMRDAMYGDLVSSNARLLKALLIAISIAAGVGIVLAVYVGLGGAL